MDKNSSKINYEKKYRNAIEFIERIESLTSDRDVANKIYRYLVEQNEWKIYDDTTKHYNKDHKEKF